MLSASVALAADVQLSQFTDAPDPAVRGGTFTYTLSVENNAADTATSVVLTIPLPATTTFVSLTGTGGSHDGGSPGTVTYNFGDLLGTLAGGSVRTVTVTVQTTAATGATVNASASVTSSSGDTNADNNSLSQTTTIDDGADLVLTKSGLPNPVIAGANVSWTVSATNQGPNDAENITVTDTLPVNMTYASASGSGWSCSQAGQSVTCTRASLANGASAPDITIVASVSGAVSGTLTNTVTAVADTDDPNPNNTITADVTVTAGADLAITKTVAPNPTLSNQNATFTLAPRNTGPFAASTVTVTDTLPPSFSYVSVNGTGWTCGESAGTITCTRATYAVGATDDISIVATAPTVAALTAAANSAAMTATTADPVAGNNNTTLNFNVVPDGVDLSLSKSKAPNPVAQGSPMTSTLTVHNNGPQTAAAGTITVTDTLDIALETYTDPSYSGANWSCSYSAPAITCIYNAALASGANASALVITTTATGVGAIANNAAVTYSGTPGDWNAGNNAASSSVVSTFNPLSADLSIAKATSTVGGVLKTLEHDEDTVTYTLTVSNAGPGAADGVVVSDAIPGYIAAATAVTAAKTGGTSAAAFTCATGATVTCTQQSGTIALGETVIFTITASRALRDGDFTNTATVTSTTLGDPAPGNNSAADTITIDPIADVQMQSKLITPDTVRAGVNATYVMTFRNNGPSSALGVGVTDTFTVPGGDTGFTVISVSASQGVCAGLNPGSSYGPGAQTLTCTVGTLTSGQSETVTLVIRPNWMAAPPDPRTLDNTVAITTTTWENTAHTDNGNNSQSATLTIDAAAVDILVNKTDTTPAGPDPLGYTPSPSGNDNLIAYRIATTNRGPSLATGVTFSDTIAPPAGKVITLLRVSDSAFGAASATTTCLPAPPQTSGAGAPLATSCTIGQDLSAGATVERYLIFQVETAPNSGGDTYADTVTVACNETDSNPANNTENETTTVRVRSDLSVTKTASTTPVQLREPFYWTLQITNNGPGDSLQTTLTDTLPTGMVFYTPAQAAAAPAPYNASPYSAGPVWSNDNATPGNGACSTSGQVLTCNFGLLENGKVVTLTVPVRVTTYAASLQNCATAATSEVDPNSANNTSQCGTVAVQRSSLAGTVYRDLNNNALMSGAGETSLGVVVQVRLTGTDAYGNAVSTNVNSNSGTGVFTFSNLSPANNTGYTLIETSQPANFFDGQDAAGSSGGTVAAVGSDQISAILLAANTTATGYLFGELPPNTLGGYVYSDANNNGVRGGGEAGINGVTLALTGTDYGPDGVAGGGDDVAVNLSTTTNASGVYAFTALRAGDYTVTETQPGAYLDGLETAGTIGGAACGGCSTALNEVISGIVISSFGVTAAEMNFGELAPAGIGGFVYVDVNDNAFKDSGEDAGLPGVTLTLTGTDDLGGAVNTTASAAADGSYGFATLRPGTYVVTETQPVGMDNTGAQAGVPVSGTPTLAAVTPQVISAIPVIAGAALVQYNFGHSGTLLSGYVYIDGNGSGQKDPGELGIPGVAITLSGNAALGGSVCAYIGCAATTDSNGAFAYIDLPTSGAGGYTLTEQSQAVAPLTNYQDGAEHVGTVNSVSSGTAGNDTISAISIALGQIGVNYLFGELAASLAGTVYHDVDDNGSMNGGDAGLPNVTITLSGTSASGNNVCTLIPSCTTTTAGDGTYSFQGLPASNGTGYTLTETQPTDYVSRSNNIGTAGGVAGVNTFTGVILTTGASAANYRFGEKTGSLTGFVYHDLNNDGVQDAGEPGIDGVLLTLSGNRVSGAAVNVTATSAAGGRYTFTGLFNADGAGYTVTETQPTGYFDGQTSQGLVDGVACAACTNTVPNVHATIPLDASRLFTAFNFGELQAASLSGRVYFDANLNSSYDAGEALAGVTITLTGMDDQGTAVNSVATTQADGTYSFTDLRPSNGTGYTITETQPNGIGNFSGNTGTQVGTVSSVQTGAAGSGADSITAIVLPQGIGGIDYNFRENASGLAGFVYQDANDNGTLEGGEAGIAGVVMTLTGTDANGAAVSASTTSAADGGFSFVGLTSGTYTLTETHPNIYQDGRETAGGSGGTVDNSSFSLDAAQNRIATINLAVATSAAGYLFGEREGLAAAISGKVWFNSQIQDQIEQPGEPGQPRWIVQILRGGAVVASTTTGDDGTYSFANLAANTGYEVRFLHPSNSALYGKPVSQHPGYADSVLDYSHFTIANLTLRSGAVITEQNLPLDPSGVVYHSVTRAPVTGATVTIDGPPGFNAAAHLAGGAANQSQVTDQTGYYQFLLLPGAPAGSYTLTTTSPAGYRPGVSTILPPTSGPLDPGLGSGAYLIQPQVAPPTGAQATTYYLTFTLSAASANVVNNHIPIDPITDGAITVQKTTPKINVSRGDLVPYTLIYTNNLAARLSNIDLRDRVPPGFKFRKGSATLDGVAQEPISDGRELTWRNVSFDANQRRVIRLMLVIGAGVGEGEYTNQAWAFDNLVGTNISNTASVAVRVVPDPTFDCSDLIGKVFDDPNANGYQDDGEPGIPNVRVATVRGLLVTTDAEGRFHITCADVPNEERGANFIMKLDPRTLPSGYRLTTENPHTVRLTRGKMAKLNFGATIHRVVRLELSDQAFAPNKAEPLKDLAASVDQLLVTLRTKPSVVRLAYHRAGESDDLIASRLQWVRKRLQILWKDQGCCYDLAFEEEIFERRQTDTEIKQGGKP
ncbi:MAG: SdrD B-like domain-containing protein [Desulfatitalea sp.]